MVNKGRNFFRSKSVAFGRKTAVFAQKTRLSSRFWPLFSCREPALPVQPGAPVGKKRIRPEEVAIYACKWKRKRDETLGHYRGRVSGGGEDYFAPGCRRRTKASRTA